MDVSLPVVLLMTSKASVIGRCSSMRWLAESNGDCLTSVEFRLLIGHHVQMTFGLVQTRELRIDDLHRLSVAVHQTVVLSFRSSRARGE